MRQGVRPGYSYISGTMTTPASHRWRGVFRIRVRVMHRGRQIHRCQLRTRWRVLRVQG